MELRDINYFAVVAEHRSVRRASEVLALSPPAISKSLRRLEKAMQAKLVVRTPRGVELTPIGSALLARVDRIRLTLHEVEREAADLSHGKTGSLRVGMSPAMGQDLPTAFVRLLQDAPELALQIVTTGNDMAVPMLLKGELDLIFNYLDFISGLPYKGLIREHLYDDVVVVCASTNHPLAKRKRVELADLAREHWVVSSSTFSNAQWFCRAFEDNGLPLPQVQLEARSIQLRLQAVAASNLIGYIPRRMLRRAARGISVKELPVKELIWRRPVGLMYRDGGYLSPAAKRLIGILKEMAKEITAKSR